MGEQVDVTEGYVGRHIRALDELRDLDAEFAASCEAIFGHPYRHPVLAPREQALIVLAAEAVIPQADEERLAAAIQQAIDLGASRDEVMCMLEIASSIGIHSVSCGLPILLEEMAMLGIEAPQEKPREAELKLYMETAGPRPRPLNSIYAAILRMDPEYFEHRVHFIDLPYARAEALGHKIKHLASIAIDAVSPQHYVDGLRKHIQGSLQAGITPEEIMEVLELVSVTGLRTLDVGVPLVHKAFAGTEG